jgi:ubiquinone/menaquinone biosynthesis C-methylase UbiE
MKRATLNLLVCPRCKGPLTLLKPPDVEVIDFGELACTQCDRAYPIKDGTLHLISKKEVEAAYPTMEEQTRKGARYYDLLLSMYSKILEMNLDEARAEYLGKLELTPNAKILDVGVGTGTELRHLWPKTTNAQLFGLDISVEMLGECRRNLGELNAPAELFVGFADRLPFKDNAFDVVFHTGSVNEFTDQRTAIAEMVRVAKPGTRIVITDEWITAQNTQTRFGQRLIRLIPSLSRDVVPPAHHVPPEMKEKRVDAIWRGFGYCLTFRK